LNQYELDFLGAFGKKDPINRRSALQDMTVALVKSVSEKMKGFSRKETQDYYKSIMEQAWRKWSPLRRLRSRVKPLIKT